MGQVFRYHAYLRAGRSRLYCLFCSSTIGTGSPLSIPPAKNSFLKRKLSFKLMFLTKEITLTFTCDKSKELCSWLVFKNTFSFQYILPKNVPTKVKQYVSLFKGSQFQSVDNVLVHYITVILQLAMQFAYLKVLSSGN